MKKDWIKALVAVLVVGGITYLVASVRPAYEPTKSMPFSPATAAKKSSINDRVVMRVNGEPVTETEFMLFLRQAPEGTQAFFASDKGKRIAADELVKLKMLEQEGRRLGIDRDPQIAAQLQMTQANVIASNTLRKIVTKPTEAQLRAEYQKAKASLETIRLSHVLVAYEGGQIPPRSGKPLREAAAMHKARSIAARARGGADFSALARNESDDATSAREGGSLGPVAPGALPPEIDAVVQKLKPGEVSDPVKSPFGIHVFKAGPRESQSFESIRKALSTQLEQQKMDEAVKRLQKSVKVELDPKFFPPQPAKRGS